MVLARREVLADWPTRRATRRERMTMTTTAPQMIADSYVTMLRVFGGQLSEDRIRLFQKAAVATAEYLGRPLTAEEMREASDLADAGVAAYGGSR